MSNVKFPLSKREKVQLKEIQNAFSSTSSFGISNDEKSRLLDALSLLIERNIIVDLMSFGTGLPTRKRKPKS